MWIPVTVAIASAIFSVVFAVFSFGAKREISRRDKKLEELEASLQELQREFPQHQNTCLNMFLTTDQFDRLETFRAGQVAAWQRANESLERNVLQALEAIRKMKT